MARLRAVLASVSYARRLREAWLTLRVAGADPFRARLFMTVRPYTMVSGARLRNIHDVATDIERRGIRGAFAECGVWRGGCAAVMAAVSRRAGSHRPVWLFDSFEGLPEPSEADGRAAAEYAGEQAGGQLRSIGRTVATADDVREIMGKLKIDPTTLIIREGWFQSTIPQSVSTIGPIALLRLDGDWYESTLVCLQGLYDLVVSGGVVVIDDYDYWEGCRRAVDDFFAARGEQVVLRPITGSRAAPDGRYLVKM